ncbi:MAG: S-layer homology domain-containing protein [Candidatus Peribacteraceae bacterium]|nr:S-layer homology domain-containing protein [Candidatus Peribacteraceae bacterium]
MRTLLLSFLSVVLLGASGEASAASPLRFTDFHTHDFDASVLRALGFGDATVLYFNEIGSLTDIESAVRKKYEPVGCYPFYVMKEGLVEEMGYNCATFYCVGFQKGPKQCKDRDGNPYGGIVEMNRRLGLVTINDERKYFSSYPDDEQTPAMRQRMEELAAIRCRPFYVLRFDMLAGEGYECDELGRYPYYSGQNTCIEDWRTADGLQCTIPQRSDEADVRRNAIARMSASSVAPSSSGAVGSASSGATSSSGTILAFPDVEEGKYGYTAIMNLAALGIIRGYPDGTYRPAAPVTRAEFAALLVRSLGKDELGMEEQCFPDIGGQWFSAAVCAAKRLGWVRGYDDGRYRPEGEVLRSEAMKMAVLASGLAPDAPDAAETWFAPYVRAGYANGLILEPQFPAEVPATRADVAVWLYRSLKTVAAK